MPRTAYEFLQEQFEKIIKADYAARVRQMELEVVTEGAEAEKLAEECAAFKKERYALVSMPEVAALLAEAEAQAATLSPFDRRNLQLMRMMWTNEAGLPADLASAVMNLDIEGPVHHRIAKQSGDWSEMQEWLRHCFDTMSAVGAVKKPLIGANSVYEAVLATFCPGLSEKTVNEQLGLVERELPAIIRDAMAKQAQEQAAIPLTGPFPRAQQEELNRRLAVMLGFDFSRGKMTMIDNSPSCDGGPDDTRLTTDFIENDFLNSAYSVAHEGGHALYRQNLPQETKYQPIGMVMGCDIDEAISKFYEAYVCQTPEFFQLLEKEARDVFGRPDDPALSAENLMRLKNHAQPSLIRIYADELTYPAHIVLRHKIESQLVEGKMKIEDVPATWNALMQKYLGLTPANNSEGCLQDVHYPVGYIGYFPSYVLGNMGAAQLFAAMEKAVPEVRAEIAQGNLQPIKEWLTKNVFSKASSLSQDELYTAATGEKLNAAFYLNHLSQRFAGKPWKSAPQAPKPGTPEL